MKRFFSEVPRQSARIGANSKLLQNIQRMQLKFLEESQKLNKIPNEQRPKPVSDESLNKLQEIIEETQKHSVY